MNTMADGEREKFEAWCGDRYDLATKKDTFGERQYKDRWVQGAFVGWQSSIAARQPVNESPMAKMAAALHQKAAGERAEFDRRVQSGEWGPMPDPYTQADFCQRCDGSGWDGESRETICPSCSGGGIAHLETAARQPVGEPVGYMTKDRKHVAHPSDATEEYSVPLYAAPPAQDVDLGQFRASVLHAYEEVHDGYHSEKLGALLALIDSQEGK